MHPRVLGAVVLIAGIAAVGGPALAQEEEGRSITGRLYGQVSSLQWEEFGESGGKLLKESGAVWGVGGSADLPIGARLTARGTLEGFFGTIDYDGAIQYLDGTTEPYKSNTRYRGAYGLAELGWDVPAGSATVRPFAGVGLRTWKRDIDWQDGQVGPLGYTEDWTTTFAAVGGRVMTNVAGLGDVMLGGMARFALDNAESIDNANIGGGSTVDLEPGKEVTVRFELGVDHRPFHVGLYFENLRFSRSANVPVGDDVVVWQPESKGRMLGGSVGVTF